MRPVWPLTRPPVAAVEAILQTQAFCTRRHVQHAEHILEQRLLGMGKLEALFGLICLSSPTEPPRTPERFTGSLGDTLGVFASLISLYNRLMKYVAATPTLEELRPAIDAPVAKRFRNAELPLPVPHRSPLVRGVRPLDRAFADLRLQTANQLREDDGRPGRASGHSYPRASQELLGMSLGTIIDSESETKAVGPLLPSPRAPPETVVVDFLVNFMAAIALQIQPFGCKPVCVADAFEQNFRFGPVPGPAPGLEASFLARIDGGIPCCKPQVEGELFVAFEVKRSHRGLDDVQIRAQETMEHCAIIWERHSRELVSYPRALYFSG